VPRAGFGFSTFNVNTSMHIGFRSIGKTALSAARFNARMRGQELIGIFMSRISSSILPAARY